MRRTKRKKKDGIDPISTAFDQMKRVKNPPIRLKDFASVEAMREEINEVVAFLQNPRAFQEMGARAPRLLVYNLEVQDALGSGMMEGVNLKLDVKDALGSSMMVLVQ
ncbi:unnamed protein product [Ilex paraguariensis]|uniref:Uncharacterized protein n=1 Tax=Ilex paraguariensis TaxID=185542 RepID=A0ABC8SHL8_9AQUA